MTNEQAIEFAEMMLKVYEEGASMELNLEEGSYALSELHNIIRCAFSTGNTLGANGFRFAVEAADDEGQYGLLLSLIHI